MILGVGIDLVPVARVERMLNRYGDRFVHRMFRPGECRGRGGLYPPESLAARIAAKEAAFKALGTGRAGGVRWTDVEVVGGQGRAPGLRLHGAARERALVRGVRRVHVSLTHQAGTAAAVVVLEGESP